MKNADSKANKIREITLELLNDGKIHTTKEIMDIAVQQKVIPDKNTDIVYNVLFHMKRKGMIEAGPGKSQYIIGKVYEYKRDVEDSGVDYARQKKLSEGVKLNLDVDKYSLLKPLPTRFSKSILAVKENGELKMNSVLMNNIKERNIEIFISKDLHTIILNPSGTCVHKFTKAGTAKNKEIVSMLKKLRIKFPILYTVDWNESVGAWEGILDVSEKL